MNEDVTSKIVNGHRCLGYWESHPDYGYEFCCGYEPDFECDECVFVVGFQGGDYRKGKRPWREGASQI